ncbi:hypothetical protein [Pseudidiomarina sp.]|uniref:WD40/YVTN/BNR-like repeat-containing protein n=1 Tax=Pseudidiomarina sp. TaxID=2081707 RepID=UPI00299CE317|nr:hypothetical protein [Pseudidiomarina sp.]MDX1705834.1 hypothetical protein [Pseudidiomarina sp.]
MTLRAFALLAAMGLTSSIEAAVPLEVLPARTDINWIGISTPSADVIWLSGSSSTIGRSVDGGASWDYFQPASADLEFRDIEATSASEAYALSIGKGGASRIYHTGDGGRNWQLHYRAGSNQFLNCMAMSETGEAWVYGDSVDSLWSMVRGADGRNWLTARNVVDSKPLPGEGGLAASGSCIRYKNNVWVIGTANATTARLLIKRDFGIRFKAIDSPLPAGPSAGIASVWPFSQRHALLAGGDLNNSEARPRLVRYEDGEFTPLSEPPLAGALYSLTVLPDGAILVSNPDGAALLPAANEAWLRLSEENIWNSACVAGHCYLAGKSGYVAKFSWPAAATD